MKFAVRKNFSSSLVESAAQLFGVDEPLAVYNDRKAAIQDAIARNSGSTRALQIWNGSMQHFQDFLYIFVTDKKYAGDRLYYVSALTN